MPPPGTSMSLPGMHAELGDGATIASAPPPTRRYAVTTQPTEWYWCFDHGAVEAAARACAAERRIGPFATADEAARWKDRVEARNQEWDAADRAWEGDD